jgi:hypothetical protein
MTDLEMSEAVAMNLIPGSSPEFSTILRRTTKTSRSLDGVLSHWNTELSNAKSNSLPIVNRLKMIMIFSFSPAVKKSRKNYNTQKPGGKRKERKLVVCGQDAVAVTLSKRWTVTKGWRKLLDKEIHNSYCLSNIVRKTNGGCLGWARNVACWGK